MSGSYHSCARVTCARQASHRVFYSYGEERDYCLDHAAEELLKHGRVDVTHARIVRCPPEDPE